MNEPWDKDTSEWAKVRRAVIRGSREMPGVVDTFDALRAEHAEMTALLADARPVFIEEWFMRRDALLARIQGEAE